MNTFVKLALCCAVIGVMLPDACCSEPVIAAPKKSNQERLKGCWEQVEPVELNKGPAGGNLKLYARFEDSKEKSSLGNTLMFGRMTFDQYEYLPNVRPDHTMRFAYSYQLIGRNKNLLVKIITSRPFEAGKEQTYVETFTISFEDNDQKLLLVDDDGNKRVLKRVDCQVAPK